MHSSILSSGNAVWIACRDDCRRLCRCQDWRIGLPLADAVIGAAASVRKLQRIIRLELPLEGKAPIMDCGILRVHWRVHRACQWVEGRNCGRFGSKSRKEIEGGRWIRSLCKDVRIRDHRQNVIKQHIVSDSESASYCRLSLAEDFSQETVGRAGTVSKAESGSPIVRGTDGARYASRTPNRIGGAE